MSAAVTVVLPDALRRLFPDAPERVALEAATVGEAIRGLDVRFPGMADRLCEPGPRLRRNINVFVGCRKAVLSTPLAPAAVVVILPAVTG